MSDRAKKGQELFFYQKFPVISPGELEIRQANLQASLVAHLEQFTELTLPMPAFHPYSFSKTYHIIGRSHQLPSEIAKSIQHIEKNLW